MTPQRSKRTSPVPPPAFRRLRGYTFDPSLSTHLDTAMVNEVVFKVPWEDQDTLGKGPVGEYLEVVDYDPASGCFYEPVDLDDPLVLAQDGLSPSEGNPQFHQQMVYAVAMTTIRNFERALGRWALWAPHTIRLKTAPERLEEVYIQRLRIYPHALREANAYYSPSKKALLFGYFPASADRPGAHLPGGTVFTCLSHDIIAHEITHALLDGMHRRYIEPSHPDSLAFHEAFSDIVALFQHFTFPEVLRHQIARTRGDLTSQSLLGELAQQFGQAIGNYGALRDAIGRTNPETGQWEPLRPDPQEYQTIIEPHDRGALLVAAVFDAFITIYKSRVADLIRIATSGSGVLPAGALQPDLVKRLADEAAKTSQHILNMCIRALDYSPPVDLNFGDYLRAVVTADTDLIPYDDKGYRIAMIDAFRRRGIYPRGVRTLSSESLCWPGVEGEALEKAFEPLAARLRGLRGFIDRSKYFANREESYQETEKMRAIFHQVLRGELGELGQFEELTGLALSSGRKLPGLRLKNGQPVFEVHSLRPAQRVGPDNNLLNQLIISITQRRDLTLDPAGARGGRKMVFRGGCTLILDLDTLKLRYRIVKPIDDEARLERQRQYMSERMGGTLRATYFSELTPALQEPFALLHRSFE